MSNVPTIMDLEEHVNKIFSLEQKLINRDFKIIMLEYELALTKSLLESVRSSIKCLTL